MDVAARIARVKREIAHVAKGSTRLVTVASTAPCKANATIAINRQNTKYSNGRAMANSHAHCCVYKCKRYYLSILMFEFR